MLSSSFWRWFSQKLIPIAEIDMGQKKIRGLPTTGFPALDGDPATKKYVDDLLMGAESEETLDNFEYPNDGAAQAAYVTNGAYGPDVLTGGTPSADSVFTKESRYASCAVDNNTATWWQCSNSAMPHWWKYDFGAGEDKIIGKLRLISRNGAGYDTYLKDFKLQGSHNDSSWYDIYSGQYPNVETWQTYTFPNSTAYRYYRVYIINNWYPNQWAEINEVEMMEFSLQCFSEADIRQQGLYSLKGAGAKTVSLNKTLTRSIGSPINLGTSDLIKFYIRSSRTGQNIKIGIRDAGGTTTEITPNITVANDWHMIPLDMSEVAGVDKDAIDRIIATVVNADAATIFYLDYMYAMVVAVSAGVRNWIELLDTPGTFTGQANKLVRVKSDESGLEFVSVPGGGDMLKSIYDPNEDGTVVDSDKLEGSTKAQVRAHTPVSHPLNQHGAPTAHVLMSGKKLIELGDPTELTDAVNKQYADTKLGSPDYESGWTLIDNGEVHEFEHNLNSLNLLFLAFSANESSPTEWIDLFAPEEREVTENALGSKDANIIQLANNLGASRYFKLLVWKLGD